MKRLSLKELAKQPFDVVVIGAGINGSGVAQHWILRFLSTLPVPVLAVRKRHLQRPRLSKRFDDRSSFWMFFLPYSISFRISIPDYFFSLWRFALEVKGIVSTSTARVGRNFGVGTERACAGDFAVFNSYSRDALWRHAGFYLFFCFIFTRKRFGSIEETFIYTCACVVRNARSHSPLT